MNAVLQKENTKWNLFRCGTSALRSLSNSHAIRQLAASSNPSSLCSPLRLIPPDLVMPKKGNHLTLRASVHRNSVLSAACVLSRPVFFHLPASVTVFLNSVYYVVSNAQRTDGEKSCGTHTALRTPSRGFQNRSFYKCHFLIRRRFL